MRSLVIGGSGLLGSALVRILSSHGKVSYTYNRNPILIEGGEFFGLDLLDPDSAARLIRDIRPEVIFHCAANPSVDWHEREKEAALRLNSISMQSIAGEALRIKCKLVYISSAFVFPSGAFSEDDAPHPINHYGMTKKLAEDAARSDPDHLILRTDQIYGWPADSQKQSFVSSVLSKLEKGEKAQVCADWYNCPTYVHDLAAAAVRLVENGRRGTYHAIGADYLNRYEWALKIADTFGMDRSQVTPIDSSVLDLPAKRPNVRLSNARLVKDSGIGMKGVDAGLEAMRMHGRRDGQY